MSKPKAADWLAPLKPAAPKGGRVTPKAGPDWSNLFKLAEAADQPLTTEELSLWQRGLIDGNARMWNVEYVHAAQAALTQRQPAQLLAMLTAEIPAPPFLLPAIAAVIEAQTKKQGGRSPKLTQGQRKHIREQVFPRRFGLTNPSLPEKARRAEVVTRLAAVFGVSEKTIERALDE